MPAVWNPLLDAIRRKGRIVILKNLIPLVRVGAIAIISATVLIALI